MEGKDGQLFLETYSIVEKTFKPLKLLKHTTNILNFIVLWNNFSILIKNISDLKSSEAFHYTDFSIKQIILKENILICLDDLGILHFTILKKKKETRVLETLQFKHILKNVLFIFSDSFDIYVFLKKDNILYLYKYILVESSKIKVVNMYKFHNEAFPDNFTNSSIDVILKCLKCFSVDFIEKILKIPMAKLDVELSIIFLTINNILYWTILENDLNKIIDINILYTCQSDIKSFHLIKDDEIKICLNLETGSIIMLTYDAADMRLESNIVHINSSLNQTIYIDHLILYSDYDKLYKCTLDYKQNEYIIKSQTHLPILYPYSFFYDLDDAFIYCSTIHNHIYKMPLSKIKEVDIDTHYVCIPRNKSSIRDIMSEIENEMINYRRFIHRIEVENVFSSVLFLNFKQQLLKKCLNIDLKTSSINETIDYNTAIENINNLMNGVINIAELTISKNLKHKLETMAKMIKNLFFINIRIAIGKSNNSYNISVFPNEKLNICMALPNMKKIELPHYIDAKILALIPGVYHQAYIFWSAINLNHTIIDSAYYLTNEPSKSKQQPLCVEKILSLAKRNCQLLIETSKIKNDANIRPLSLYIKLSDAFPNICYKFSEAFVKHLTPSNAESIKVNLKEAHIIRGLKPLTLYVLNDVIEIRIQTTNNDHTMIIKSSNHDLCLELYIFSVRILRDITKENSRRQYVPHFDYIILKDAIDNIHSSFDKEDTHSTEILETFHKYILGALPL